MRCRSGATLGREHRLAGTSQSRGSLLALNVLLCDKDGRLLLANMAHTHLPIVANVDKGARDEQGR